MERIVRQAMSGQTPKAAALGVGVCPRTIRKWVARCRAEGLAGAGNRMVSEWAKKIEGRDALRELPFDLPESFRPNSPARQSLLAAAPTHAG